MHYFPKTSVLFLTALVLLFTWMPEPLLMVRAQQQFSERCEYNGTKSLKLTLTGWRNATRGGDWVTEFSARKEMSKTAQNVNVEVEHTIYECDGKTVVHIKGREVLGDIGREMDELLFNSKHGKNAVLLNKERSAFRMNPETEDGYGTLLSNRPLKNNEIFEIRLESKISKWGGNSIGIGVTAVPFSSFTPSLWMMDVKSKTWMMYNKDIYVDGNKNKSDYGKSLSTLEVGDKVGVMRTDNGELHIYVNGVDQGIAATGIPQEVRAVVDLIRDFVSVTLS